MAAQHDGAAATQHRPHCALRLRNSTALSFGRRIPDRRTSPQSRGSRICERISPSQHADDNNTLVFAITQSGETADTLGALRESQRKGYRTLGICNNVPRFIRARATAAFPMHAGPEIGVAADRSRFTWRVPASSHPDRFASLSNMRNTIDGGGQVPPVTPRPRDVTRSRSRKSSASSDEIKAIAKKYPVTEMWAECCFFGRQCNFSIALEERIEDERNHLPVSPKVIRVRSSNTAELRWCGLIFPHSLATRRTTPFFQKI